MQEASTRRVILEFLKKNCDSEVKAIAGFCGLTSMAVRRHLLRLRAEGLVQARTERRPQGRPAGLYSLTEFGDAQFPRDYAGLAADLLSALKALDGESKIKEVFRKRHAALTARYAARLKGKGFEARVRETAAILTECGYMAEASPSERGAYLLTEHNCAIPSVARSFPAACKQELRLIRNLAAGEVMRVAHLLEGDRHCAYRITERSPR